MGRISKVERKSRELRLPYDYRIPPTTRDLDGSGSFGIPKSTAAVD